MMNLRQLTDQAFEFSKRWIEQHDAETECIPTFLTVSTTGKEGIFVCPFDGDDSKNAVAHAMRGIMKEQETFAYCFVSEAWVVRRDRAEDIRGIIPSEEPDRVECLTIMGQDIHGGTIQLVAEIKRDGDRRTVATPDISTEMQLSGRFANLLGAPASTH